MTPGEKNGRVLQRSRAITLAIIALVVSGISHPVLMGGEGDFSSYEMLIFVLNGAVLCLLIVRTGIAVFQGARGIVRRAPPPAVTWAPPAILVGFASLHFVYDTLFFQRFPDFVQPIFGF